MDSTVAFSNIKVQEQSTKIFTKKRFAAKITKIP